MRLAELLRTMDIFENLPEETVEQIARLLRERRLQAGEVLFREGDPGDAMYVVTGGRVRLVAIDSAGNEHAIAVFGDGQFFGEISLVIGAARTGAAIAEGECRLLELSKTDFEQLLATSTMGPQITRELLRVISERTAQVNQQLVSAEGSGDIASGGGHVFAVFSPRGGAGKTTIAVNLAAALARYLPDRVGLLDLSLTFNHDALLLNLHPEQTLASVPPELLGTLDRRTLAPYLVQHASGVHLLTGANHPEEGESVTGAHVKAAIDVMRRQFLATVVDCAGNFSDPILAALEAAEKVFLVCTPEFVGIQQTRECERVFGEILHLAKGKTLVVLNHYQAFKLLTAEQVVGALQHPLDAAIPHAGDAAFRAALTGEPLVLAAPNSTFARAIDKFAVGLLPPDIQAIARAGSKNGTTRSTGETSGAAKPRKGLAALLLRR